jgi:structural maintenance of chromosomes protein 6
MMNTTPPSELTDTVKRARSDPLDSSDTDKRARSGSTEDSLNSSFLEGQIKEIELENFMNHKKRYLKLGPNLNFITGHNGSGKSAFAVGLQVCLGAKSERSSRLSGLIREGSSGPAKVRVTFSNVGSDAYHPLVYGNTISIERRIYSSGTSQYFILNQKKEVVSLY